jgi:hypothetical protein
VGLPDCVGIRARCRLVSRSIELARHAAHETVPVCNNVCSVCGFCSSVSGSLLSLVGRRSVRAPWSRLWFVFCVSELCYRKHTAPTRGPQKTPGSEPRLKHDTISTRACKLHGAAMVLARHFWFCVRGFCVLKIASKVLYHIMALLYGCPRTFHIRAYSLSQKLRATRYATLYGLPSRSAHNPARLRSRRPTARAVCARKPPR